MHWNSVLSFLFTHGNTGFDKTKYIKMLLHWKQVLSLLNCRVLKNSFVAEKYGTRIIIHGNRNYRKEVVKMRERGRWVTNICTFSNKVWSGHVAESSGELCLCGWNNKGVVPATQKRVNTLLSRAIFAKITLVSFTPLPLSLLFSFSFFRKSCREYVLTEKITSRE